MSPNAKHLVDLNGRSFDVAIIGGGVNGACAAQRLTAEGYDVLLAEMHDFGSGTSSRSSRMLHCGLRSLEPAGTSTPLDWIRKPRKYQALLKRAAEYLHARADFVKSSPGLVRPYTLTIPIGDEGPAGWKVDAAIGLLKLMGTEGVPLEYRRLRKNQLDKTPFGSVVAPALVSQGAATIREYIFEWPERICVDAALDAERMGATVLNYTTASDIKRCEDGGWQLKLTDTLDVSNAGQVTAKMIFNLAGPWIDDVQFELPSPLPKKLAVNKGVHIAVKLPERFAEHGLIAKEAKSLLLLMPSHGLHIIGSTNSSYGGDPSLSLAEADDVASILKRVNRLIPGLDIKPEDIHYRFAGVRPYAAKSSSGEGPGNERQLHSYAENGLPNLFAVTAGSVATCRIAATDVLAAARSILKPSQVSKAANYKTDDHYNLGNLLSAEQRRERLRQAVSQQKARTTADILFRRTGDGWRQGMGVVYLEEAIDALAERYDWDSSRREVEFAKHRDYLKENFGYHFEEK